MSFGIINHNVSAVNGYRQLQTTNRSLNKNLEALSSGMRINRAADDAAGLAVSEKMRAQIFGVDQAGRNAEDAISMVQTAEGVLDTTQSILQRMRVLSVQAANDTYTTYDRQRIQKEMDELITEVDRIAKYTEFNTKKLLDGSATGSANTSNNQVGSVDVVDKVTSAEYSVTVLSAGTASRIHGNANIADGTDIDNEINLRDAGIFGDQELHVSIDDQTRVIAVNEDDTLEDLKRKINRANLGVRAGLDAEGNDITLTSMRSGSRFNISFGDDPDGVATKLGLIGGVDGTLTTRELAVDSTGTSLGIAAFTSGTDTVISITNVTPQAMFATYPGASTTAGGYGQSLGIFRSNSDIFTEKELSNPINGISILSSPGSQRAAAPTAVAGWPDVNGQASSGVDLTRSDLLKGMVIRIDEQLDYGVLQRSATQDINNLDWINYFPDRNYDGDQWRYNSTERPNQVDARANVPNEEEVVLPGGATRPAAGTVERYAEDSITTFRLSVRDTRQVYHVGANEDQVMKADFGNMTAEALGLTVSMRSDGHIHDGYSQWENKRVTENLQLNVSVETQKSAERAISTIDKALNMVSQERAKFGAFQNSLEQRVNNLNISFENQTASESRIRDVDMAREVTQFTRNQILIQSGTAMLAQANAKPQSVLSLLG